VLKNETFLPENQSVQGSPRGEPVRFRGTSGRGTDDKLVASGQAGVAGALVWQIFVQEVPQRLASQGVGRTPTTRAAARVHSRREAMTRAVRHRRDEDSQ
jgi:hypothetical protein